MSPRNAIKRCKLSIFYNHLSNVPCFRVIFGCLLYGTSMRASERPWPVLDGGHEDSCWGRAIIWPWWSRSLMENKRDNIKYCKIKYKFLEMLYNFNTDRVNKERCIKVTWQKELISFDKIFYRCHPGKRSRESSRLYGRKTIGQNIIRDCNFTTLGSLYVI